MFPATARGLVIHRDQRWNRKGCRGREAGRGGCCPLLCSVPALSSTFRAVGCQATMPTLLEWPSSTTTGSVRDRVSPFSGICHTWKGREAKERCSGKGSPSEESVARLLPRPAAARAVTSLRNQAGNQGGNHSQLPINPWLIHEEHPSSLMCQHKPTAHGATPLFPCPWAHSTLLPKESEKSACSSSSRGTSSCLSKL
ncbi:hypothetical protein Nmel_015391 [Mimus melanotis]